MTLIDGKALSETIQNELKEKVNHLISSGKRAPHLAAVLVGENPASAAYVRNKIKACEKIGFRSTLIKKDDNISEDDLLQLINELNSDSDLDGYIVQLPLPKHISEEKITLAIHPNKDVDGFHPYNVGLMTIGTPQYLPATPYGILIMLERYGIDTSGKHCVVVGRSNIVGTPMSILMSRNSKIGNATVTLTHSKTANLKEETLRADILIVALGRANFINSEMVKEGAVVIDVGINSIADADSKTGYRLVGDVDFKSVSQKASFITPVPGGVGPMTVTGLLMNTMKAYELYYQ
jgi:methylenetetrahydrofolate dehydrogenase (NADP+) / methenyltetrahydrofolate cyclohydrolase